MFEIFSKIFKAKKTSDTNADSIVKSDCNTLEHTDSKENRTRFEDLQISSTKIDNCKENADPKKYFALFDRHIPRFDNDGKGKKIALVDISSLYVSKMIIECNSEAEYWLFDNMLDGELLQVLMPNAKITTCNCKSDEKMYNILDKDMKFDVVVGNPPYDKNLHLKILKKTMEYVDFEKGGEIVWLHPNTWCSYIYADEKRDFKKYSSLPFADIIQVGNLYDIFTNVERSTYGLQISYFKKTNNKFDFTNLMISHNYLYKNNVCPPSVANIIRNKLKDLPENMSLEYHLKYGKVDDTTKYTFYIPILLGNPGNKSDRVVYLGNNRWGKVFYHGVNSDGKTMSQTKKKLRNVTNYENFTYIEFDSEIEAINWANSQNTKFHRLAFLLEQRDSHLAAQHVPFMKDYTQPWTDERFYEYFKLTPEEIKLIEDTIK